MQYNLDIWGISPNQNILYVTGLPGSGKTTITELVQTDAIIIHLDDYLYFECEKSTIDDFSKFINEKEPNWIELIESSKDNATWFLNLLLLFANEKYYEHKRVIVEGFQIFSGWLCTNKFFADKPIIIIEENFLICMWRICKRDNINGSFIFFISMLLWFIKSSIQIKKLSKTVRKENAYETKS